jgi:hypothetical protein
MSASNAYQEVIAGRVREDEQIGFFRDNKIATPARVTNFKSVGGAKAPSITKNFLQTEFVGKQVNTVPALNIGIETPYNAG